MTDHDTWTPLDPNEGPTVWARQSEANPHTYEIREGTDPTDPIAEFELSAGEIRRLNTLVDDTHD